MQRRTHAVFERCLRALPGVRLISFAPFVPQVGKDGAVGDGVGDTRLDAGPLTSLALGEVRRLHDDADGYGPRGAASSTTSTSPRRAGLLRPVRSARPAAVRPAWGGGTPSGTRPTTSRNRQGRIGRPGAGHRNWPYADRVPGSCPHNVESPLMADLAFLVLTLAFFAGSPSSRRSSTRSGR